MIKNWEPTTLGKLAKYTNGRGFKKSEWKTQGIPIIRIQNLTESTVKVNYFSGQLEEKHKVQRGDLLLSWAATLDVFEFGQDIGALNQHIFKVEPTQGVDKRFLYHLLKSKISELYAETHGSGMVHITSGKFKSVKINLPQEKEQKEIVAKIDELFRELVSGLESLEKIKAQLKRYEQSYINSLFKEHGTTTLSKIVDDVRYGTSKKCGSDSSLIPVLRIPNIVKGYIDTTHLKYASFDENEIAKLSVRIGDLLIIRSNGSPTIVGKCADVTEADEGYLFAGYLIRLRFDTSLHSAKFYKYLLASPRLREQIQSKAKSTSGVNNINSEELKSLEVPIVELHEQLRILTILDEKNNEIRSLEQSVQQTEQKLINLEKSIYKKAFKGELV